MVNPAPTAGPCTTIPKGIDSSAAAFVIRNAPDLLALCGVMPPSTIAPDVKYADRGSEQRSKASQIAGTVSIASAIYTNPDSSILLSLSTQQNRTIRIVRSVDALCATSNTCTSVEPIRQVDLLAECCV